MKAAKAALVNFYETLRFELNGDVGITIATHGWIGSEMSRGKFMLEEGAEMQWKEEREVKLLFFFQPHLRVNEPKLPKTYLQFIYRCLRMVDL